MARPAPLSGFREFSPADRIVEQHVLDSLRRSFELHGFGGIETRAVEPMETLAPGGEVTKEVYALSRAHSGAESAAQGGGAGSRELGLHFDLTVPFARYVLENAGTLQFPFRRHQIQKVWRGERPQEGRFREFTQADVDVVDSDTLASHHEAEVPLVVLDALAALWPGERAPVLMHLSNRALAQGFYAGLGVEDVTGVLRAVDKLDRAGADAVRAMLTTAAPQGPGLTDAQADACLRLASIRTADTSFVAQVQALGVTDPLLTQGVDELAAVIEVLGREAPGLAVADLKIARGLDYYTGTVYETELLGHSDLGSISSGGRYDALATDGRTTYPGVGMSIGVTRLVDRLLRSGSMRATRSVPTAVVVAVTGEAERAASGAVAAVLRSRGIPTEVSPTAAKFGKQIKYADRRGIPFVWFCRPEGDEVRDLRSGEQIAAEAGSWQPPPADLRAGVVYT